MQNIYYDEAGEESGSVVYEYQGVIGPSDAVGKLDYAYDNFDGKTYSYYYDDNGSLKRWESWYENGGANYVSVRQLSSGETKYVLGALNDGTKNAKFKTQVEYDSKVTVDPRITKTSVWFDDQVDNDDDWTEMLEFTRNYKYDSLGRLEYVQRDMDFFGGIAAYSDVYTYNDNEESNVASPLVTNYSHTRDFNATWSKTNIGYTYDEKGNVTTQAITGYFRVDDSDKQVYKITKTYTYDEFNHIVSEKTAGNGSSSNINYTYENNKLVSAGSHRFLYFESGRDKGKLRYFEDGSSTGTLNITYDNYGNRATTRVALLGDALAYTYEYERGNLLKKIYLYESKDLLAEYKYNHKGVRVAKITVDGETTYYCDNAKILGEDRSDGTKLRYFYGLGGILGFSYYNGIETKKYTYFKDGFGNIIGIENNYGEILCRYEYDTMGNCSIVSFGHNYTLTAANKAIGELNPFRWKSFYFDAETGYYFVNGRYYDSHAGVFVDADDAENIEALAAEIGGLDKNAITYENYLDVEANGFDIFPMDEMVADITYDPNAGKSWWELHIVNVILTGIQLIVGVILCFIPCMQAAGIMMLGAAIGNIVNMILEEMWPAAAKVLGGMGTISSGSSAITTGISLFACGPVGWIAGTICIAVGVATVAIGVNEAISGATGTNYLQQWTGMTDEAYSRLYLGLSIASTICTTAGQAIRGLKGCRCFIAGTLVLTAAGYKAIEDIQLGDMVLAYDEETGETAYKPVVNLFRNESKDWTGVTVNGTEIVSTPGHKYYLPETKTWVSAEDLKVGTKVLLSDGSYAIIEEVRPIHYDEAQTTYNFEVEDFHTYYVGTGVLVHNRQCNDLGKQGEEYVSKATGKSKNKKVFTPDDVDGLSQDRIPDFLSETKLIEVKNVAKQCFTKQLRDYATIARYQKLKVILYVRKNTVLSKPLKNAGFIIRILKI